MNEATSSGVLVLNFPLHIRRRKCLDLFTPASRNSEQTPYGQTIHQPHNIYHSWYMNRNSNNNVGRAIRVGPLY